MFGVLEGFRHRMLRPHQLGRPVAGVEHATCTPVVSPLVHPLAQVGGRLCRAAVGPGQDRGRGTPVAVYAEHGVPEGAHGDAGDSGLFRPGESAVYGAGDEAEKLVGVFGGAAVGGVFEVVVELDLCAIQLLACAVVEPRPHRRGAHVYGQDTCVLWLSWFH